MGDVKVGGNYAAGIFAHEKAKKEGWPVELYLDAKTHKYIEEFATSNFAGITKDGTYVTPDSCSVLPSVTNMSLRQCAKDLGIKVEVRPVPYTEVKKLKAVAALHARQGSHQGQRPERRPPDLAEALRPRPGHPVRSCQGHAQVVL